MKNPNMHKRAYILGIVLLAALPVSAFAQQAATNATPESFSSDGVFSCQGGQYAQSIGKQAATGGVYVPVADATVELNTGILVYKECILRPIVDQEKQLATAGFAQQALNTIQTGRGGNAYFVQNYGEEAQGVSDNAVVSTIQNGGLSTVNSAYQGQVQSAVVQAYMARTRQPQNDLACPYAGNLQDALNGTPDGSIWDALGALEMPQCNPFFDAELASDQVDSAAAAAVNTWQTQLNWGNGYYSITDANGNIVTPGYAVSQNYVQAEQTGFNQLQAANDIGQMTNALLAGIGNTVLTPAGTQGAISELGQATGQIQQSLVGAADNAAIAILNNAIAQESAYNQAVTAIANTLTQSIGQIRGAENQCWSQVISAVCKSTPTANNTCTDAAGNNLKIATSTEFSQPIIDSQITPLAQPVAAAITKSNAALQQLQQIASGVGNSTSNDVQAEALTQLDQLTSSGALHTQQDVSNVQTQQTSVQTQMTTLVQSLATQWTGTDSTGAQTISWNGSVSSPAGWCNVNSTQTVAAWDAKWKQ